MWLPRFSQLGVSRSGHRQLQRQRPWRQRAGWQWPRRHQQRSFSWWVQACTIFSHLCSNTRTYSALICHHGVFVIMKRTMQNCWCGSVTCNFLNLEMYKGPMLWCYWLAWKDPPKASDSYFTPGWKRENFRENTFSPLYLPTTVGSAERTATCGEVAVRPWRETKSLLGGSQSHRS